MSERRIDDRVQVSISGTMVADSYVHSTVIVRDLSAGGCKVSCSPLPRVGSRVQLRLSPSTAIHGSVMWSTSKKTPACGFLADCRPMN
jgi:hypothetical protein